MSDESEDDTPYVTVHQAANLLGVVARQAHRYGENGRVRTRKAGRRTMFNLHDVERLAAELAESRALDAPQKPRRTLAPQATGDALQANVSAEGMPTVAGLLARVHELTDRLIDAERRAAMYEHTATSQRLLTDESNSLRERLAVAEAELQRLHARPWLARLLDLF